MSPRPVFGEADWLPFSDLTDGGRFPPTLSSDYPFATRQAEAADELARALFVGMSADEEEAASGVREAGYIEWPGFEFCVSRANRVVLMVRRRT